MGDVPDHSGHRARLKARFLTAGVAGVAEYELLELLLCYAIPRRDVKPLAKDLLKQFGSFNRLLAANVDELQQFKGLGYGAIALFKAVQAAALVMAQQQVHNKTVLSNWQQLIEYCHMAMAHVNREQLRLLFLDKKNRLIADEVQQEGTIDHTPAYPREIIKRALNHGASALIMVHNHPGGDPTPSQADILLTQQINQATAAVGILLHDHIIIAKTAHASFRQLGLL